jgi:hypothetical protein
LTLDESLKFQFLKQNFTTKTFGGSLKSKFLRCIHHENHGREFENLGQEIWAVSMKTFGGSMKFQYLSPTLTSINSTIWSQLFHSPFSLLSSFSLKISLSYTFSHISFSFLSLSKFPVHSCTTIVLHLHHHHAATALSPSVMFSIITLYNNG